MAIPHQPFGATELFEACLQEFSEASPRPGLQLRMEAILLLHIGLWLGQPTSQTIQLTIAESEKDCPDLPDAALVPLGIAAQISQLYPLVVAGADPLCVGQTTLYRWLSVYAAPETPICCIDLPRNFTKARLIQLVLAERLVAPALARITPQQVRDLYQHIKHAEQWPHAYRSHAHLAQLVGIKPLKGSEGRE